MNDRGDAGVRESLSCVMDGEATELEMQRVLNAVAMDSALRATWQRYQVVAAVVRGEQPVPLVDLSVGIRAAIDDLDVVACPGSDIRTSVSGADAQRLKRALLPLGRVAVAASVAVIAVLAFQQLQFGSAASAPGVQVVDGGNGPAVNGPGVNGPAVAVQVSTAPAAGIETLPEVQTPSSYLTHPAQVGARAVSMGSFVRQQQLDLIDGQTLMGTLSQEQIQAYLSALIARHQASTGTGPGSYAVEHSLQNQGSDGR